MTAATYRSPDERLSHGVALSLIWNVNLAFWAGVVIVAVMS